MAPMEATARGQPLVIKPQAGWVGVDFPELWRYRELLYFFTWRDLKVRYKQTLLGAAWAVLQPVLAMVVFTIFFDRVAHVGSQGLPYPVFSYVALLPWYLFANSLLLSSQSVVASANLVSKVYFPRVLLALSPVAASLVDFVLGFSVLAALMGYYGVEPAWLQVPAIVPLLLLVLATATGVGLWFSALNVRYRDVRYVLPFAIQIWLFASSVIVVPHFGEPWRTIYALNPMVGVVEGFRYALLDAPAPGGATLLVSSLSALAILVSGVLYFRRTEDAFADVV